MNKIHSTIFSLFIPDGWRGHDVPLCRDVILLEVHPNLDAVVAAALVDVAQVNLEVMMGYLY